MVAFLQFISKVTLETSHLNIMKLSQVYNILETAVHILIITICEYNVSSERGYPKTAKKGSIDMETIAFGLYNALPR